MARYGRYLSYPFRVFYFLSKGALVFLMLAFLGLSFATVTLPGVFGAVSEAVGALTGLRTVKSRQDARLADLETRSADLETRAAGLAEELEATRVDYRGEKRSANETVADASRRIAERIGAATARNTESMAGEALPFIGVAVIASATASEVGEACEIMKDLSALDSAFNPEDAVDAAEICGTSVPTSGEVWSEVIAGPGAVWSRTNGVYDNLPDISPSGTYTWFVERGARFLEWIPEQGDAPAGEPAE